MASRALARGVLSRSAFRLASKNRIATPFLNSGVADQWRFFSSYPSHEVVGMPSLSPTMESGTISSWNVSEGETFGAGDVLAEIETDKASVAFEAQDEGVVARILAPAGPDDINCGVPIMVIVEEEDDVAAFKDFVPEASAEDAAPAVEEVVTPPPAVAAPAPVVAAAPPAVAAQSSSSGGGRVVASPLAWAIAKENGWDLSSIAIVGTGPGGRIIADDVREYVPSAVPVAEVATPAVATVAATTSTVAPPPVVGAGFTDYPLSPAAVEIANQLTVSKQSVPHYYLTVDVTLDNIIQLRQTLNTSIALKEGEEGISLNDLIVKGAAHAMKACPTANASWMDTSVRVYDSVDVNVIIGNGDALYSPVLRDVGSKGVKSVSDEISSAVNALEEGTTTNESFNEVGTVTVMNLGMYGVKSCAPIIRQPQAVALAVGAAENRIVPNDDPDSDEIYKESVMLTATLSCDHRVVDGAVGAQWLSAFKNCMENPTHLLL